MMTRIVMVLVLTKNRGQLKSGILAGKSRILIIIIGRIAGPISKREVKNSQVLRRLITPLRSTRQLVKLS